MKPFAVYAFIAGTLLASAQTMQERAKPYLDSALAAGNSFVSVSAASGLPAISPGSLATVFGSNLASQIAIAQAPYPTSLGGISLQIVDNAGTPRPARLLYVSPEQINYVVPADAGVGIVTMNIIDGTGVVPSAMVQIQANAPALFTANGNGRGVVAAVASVMAIPTDLVFPVPVFECGDTPGSCVSVPIDPGLDRPVVVTLYATGLRGRSSDAAVILTIGGMNVPIRGIASGDSNTPLAGIDEVAFGLPLALRGSGEVDVVLTVDGAASNTARINIK